MAAKLSSGERKRLKKEIDKRSFVPDGFREQIKQASPAIGVTADASYKSITASLEVGDVLLTVVAAPPRVSRVQSDQFMDANDLAESFLHHLHLSPRKLVDLADRLFESKPHVWPHRPSLLIAQRV